jgi:hypothetical protein
VRREQLDHVATHAEAAAGEIMLGALVLQRHQIGDELALLDTLAQLDAEGHRRIGLDRADAVDAGDRGDDDDVVALDQRARRRMAHPVDLLVDRGFLLDEGVRARHIGLGLVVVVIRDEILDRVVGEEALELAIELRRQRLVRRQDQRRALRLLDHLRHGEGLARAGDAEQHLVALLPRDALDQLGDRGRLVAGRLVFGVHPEADAALGLVGPRRAVRHPGLARLDEGVAALQQRLQRGRGRGRRALGPDEGGIGLLRELALGPLLAARPFRGVARLRLVAGLRLVGKPGRAAGHGLAAVDRRVEQIGEIALERLQLLARRLGIGRARRGRLLGGLGLGGRVFGRCVGHGCNMGRIPSARERGRRMGERTGDRSWQE